LLSKFVECLYPKSVPVDDVENTKYMLVVQDRTLLARALNLQFLCHMYYWNGNILENIKKYNTMNIFYGYDVNVIINCIKIEIDKMK
jgi:hypothetical protein